MKKDYLKPIATIVGLTRSFVCTSKDPYGNDLDNWGDVTDEYNRN
jgi:hypothetical protein